LPLNQFSINPLSSPFSQFNLNLFINLFNLNR
jgi:hypothetical protein